MVEKGITGGISHAIHQYGKANNKYMKEYGKHKESSYLKYRDVKDLYGRAMSQKLPVNNFEWIENTSQYNEDFIKGYWRKRASKKERFHEESNEGYFLEVDVKYPEKLRKLHTVFTLFIWKSWIEKIEKLVTNLHDKTEYDVHVKNLKQALNHGLVLKKVHRVIRFNQKAWLKLYIDMNTKLRKKAKNNFEKDFFKPMKNAVFEKTMEMVRKHRRIKL